MQPVRVHGKDNIDLKTDADGHIQADILSTAAPASLPLPTGAATAALQTTGNTSLGNIDTQTDAIGATTDAAASVSADEDATARTLVGIQKGQKNILIDISGFVAPKAYKGASRKTMAGAAQEVTISSGATMAHIFAEVGDIRFAVDGDADATSSGYVIAGGAAVVYLSGATKLSVYGATGAYANVVFYG